jgi:excisionase family DNA binding protein
MEVHDDSGNAALQPPAPLDVTKAAAYLARPPSYVRRAVRERKIGFYKVGGRIRFSQADLDEHLEAGHVPVGGQVRPRSQRTATAGRSAGGIRSSGLDLVQAQRGVPNASRADAPHGARHGE